MKKNFFDPNDFPAESDSKMIQMAVDEAAASGCSRVVIPAYNSRTDSYLWVIDEAIELPSHMYVEINNAHLRMADGVYCQMFRNSNAFRQIGLTEEGLQEDIVIQGVGGALLDGGLHNGLREKTSQKDGLPDIVHNLTIYLHNVRNFRIGGFTVRDQRWWALCFLFAWEGTVSNIRFELTDWALRGDPDRPWKNQDGVDLRVGCHDISIHDLYGETGDDIVALTALAIGERGFERVWYCSHLKGDIYNVDIHDIIGTNNHCKLVRLLCHGDNQIYNISIHNIFDQSLEETCLDPLVYKSIRTSCCVEIGENDYFNDIEARKGKPDDMHDIAISSIYSSALAAVDVNWGVKNLSVRDVFVKNPGGHALSVSKIKAGRHEHLDDPKNITYLENVLVDGVFFHSDRADAVPFFFDALVAKNVRIRNVSYKCGNGSGLVKNLRPQAESEAVSFENITEEI